MDNTIHTLAFTTSERPQNLPYPEPQKGSGKYQLSGITSHLLQYVSWDTCEYTVNDDI